ncbi:conserved hypothetical protein [Sporisorium reilianum SRZ2]|uniref:Uncharacterized protein n=1 Tax=Sporisorium reilianum (strain SRZ2) TaxID=999809 RepID=E7A0A7_SPORE|nr:conserved hypothetical protein [Sporisorium reilianum SRZ2]
MRSFFFTLLVFCLVVAGSVLAQDMPAAVEEFEETKALWHNVFSMNYFPWKFETQRLRQFPEGPWQAFLKDHGDTIISQAYGETPQGKKGTGSVWAIDAMKTLANTPGSMTKTQVNTMATKQIAGKVIEAYANHLKAAKEAQAEAAKRGAGQAASSSVAPEVRDAVYRHMQQVDDNDALLYDPRGRQWSP